ncbi:ribosomal protein S13 [Ophiocordyceps camponoti-floridani]|uniref:Ribosomal protein S13 n=1 Tax=Ophiocordyceps camponoti-floridani TaxID=2030778 RepID=A0A8H4Q4C9_9HYPO|nr:ribosomal protein S13 [Ophiocordyceps camponoti-floridani]
MVFIMQINFPEGQLVKKALESFYALGPKHSARIMAKFSIFKLAKVETLTPKIITSLNAELSSMKIGVDAVKLVQENIRRLRDNGSTRGRRHAMGLPVRGQRTRTQTATANKLNRVNRGFKPGNF